MTERKIFTWLAWDAKRERICDSGTALVESRERARHVAWMCLGGPHVNEVAFIEVKIAGVGRPPSAEEQEADQVAQEQDKQRWREFS